MGSDQQLRSSPPGTHCFVASGRLTAGVADSPDGCCVVSLLAEGTNKQQQGQALPLRIELIRISADGRQMEVLANAEISWAGQHPQHGAPRLQCCCSASASTPAMLIWQPGGNAGVWNPPRGGLPCRLIKPYCCLLFKPKFKHSLQPLQGLHMSN